VSPTASVQPAYHHIRGKKDTIHINSLSDSFLKALYGTMMQEGFRVKTFIFVDDVTAESEFNDRGKGTFSKLIFNTRWINLSIMVCTHSVTAVTKAMRENSDYVFCFKTVRRVELETIWKEWLGHKSKNDFLEEYNKSMVKKHVFLWIRPGEGQHGYSILDALSVLRQGSHNNRGGGKPRPRNYLSEFKQHTQAATNRLLHGIQSAYRGGSGPGGASKPRARRRNTKLS
jgi:hypothetical protein